MRFVNINFGVLFVFAIFSFIVMTGEGFSQQGCKQVCVKETVQCLKRGNTCVQHGSECAQYRNNCVAYNRHGGCTRYQQVCAQHRQVCTQYQQTCIQEQKVCSKYDTVCSSQPTKTPGKAFQQLQEINKGKDSIFDGGPGSTLNRQ